METFYDGKTPRISPKIGSLCDGGCACVPPNASYSVFEAGEYVTFEAFLLGMAHIIANES